MKIEFEKVKMNDYIENRYNYVGDASEGLTLVMNHQNLFGYIDKTGNEVIPCQYNGADNFSEGLAVVKVENNYFFIDKEGKIVLNSLDEYTYVGSFHNGRARVKRKDDCWGYLDKTGKEVISCQYKEAGDFNEDLAIVVASSSERFVININGNIQTQFKGNYRFWSTSSFNNGIMPIEISTGYENYQYISGFVDKSGKVYKQKEDVGELEKYYQGIRPSFLDEDNRVNEATLINYCSNVKFLNQEVQLKASSEEELQQMKKQLLNDIREAITTFVEQNLEEFERDVASADNISEQERKKKINF